MIKTEKIRLEYGERIMGRIAETEEWYVDFFNEMINLYNNELMNNETMLQIISSIFLTVYK
jgi:hypothetical protein